jgi:hypothetical protein
VLGALCGLLGAFAGRAARTEITSATRTTRTASTSARTTTARTTGATRTTAAPRTTSATRTTTTTIAELARRGRELPADARARHLAATRTIVFLLLFLRRAHLQAAETARLVAIAATTEAAGTATTATTAALTALAAAAIIATIVTTSTRGSRDAIDHVVKLAARHRAVRTLLALEHANEANVVEAIADDVERLEQTRRAIGLNVQRRRDCIGRRIRSGRRSGLATFARRSGLAAFGLGARAFRCLAAGLTRRLARRRLGSRGSGRRSASGLTGGGRIAEQERRELGQRLHCTG